MYYAGLNVFHFLLDIVREECRNPFNFIPDTGNIATASPEQQFIGGDDDKGELANIEIYWVRDSISTTEVAEFKFSLAVYVSSLTANMLNFFWVCRESLFFLLIQIIFSSQQHSSILTLMLVWGNALKKNSIADTLNFLFQKRKKCIK